MASITTGTPEEKKGRTGGYTQKYQGGDAGLDSALKSYSDRYFQAKAAGDAAGMREANDAANRLRNQHGYAAEFAGEDIAKTAARNAGRGGGGGGSAGGAAVPERTGLGTPADYSKYIEEMNRAQQEAALNELKAAYEKNMAALDRTRETIGPAYQQARNQAAGASEQARRQFAEYAAAQGLNSGAGGQAELARQNTLQGNLNTLDTQEASRLADLELQRAQAERDYNGAIAQAKAGGNYALAQQLYGEKVRLEEALRQMQLAQAQLDLQNWQAGYQVSRDQVSDQRYEDQMAYQKQQDALKWAYQKDADAYDRALAKWQLTGALDGESARVLGLPAGIRTTDYAYQQAQMARTSPAGRTGGGGGSGTGGSGGADYAGLFAAAQASGYPKSFIANNYKKYGFSSGTGLYDAYTDWKFVQPPQREEELSPAARRILENYRHINPGTGANIEEVFEERIRTALNNGEISRGDADYLLNLFGY